MPSELHAPGTHAPDPQTHPRESDAWAAGWNGQGLENYSGSGPFPSYTGGWDLFPDPALQEHYQQGYRDGKAVDAYVAKIFAGASTESE